MERKIEGEEGEIELGRQGEKERGEGRQVEGWREWGGGAKTV